MELKKKELIISIFLVVVFLFGTISLSVFAADDNEGNNTNQVLSFESLVGNSTANNTENDTLNEIPTQNTKVNANQNTPDKLADTGLESLPLAIIAICGISAIFAYKKIREYKAY